jgi:hypothetical protein
VGAVIAKGAFWLPSFVPVIALPGLADPQRRRRTARLGLSVVVATGVSVTGLTAVFGDVAVRLIGGSAYMSLSDQAWLFAAAGSLLAVVQLLLYSRVAGVDRRVAVPMWLLVGAEVVVIWFWSHDTIAEVIATVLSAAACAVVLGLVAEIQEHDALRVRPDQRTSAP